MNIKNKIVSCILSASLIASFVPFGVYAGNDKPKVRIVIENNTNTSSGAAWTGTLVDEWVDLDDNSTAVSLFTDLLSEKGYTQTGAESGYITDINGVKAEGMGGWMFGYDDWFGNNGINSFKTEDGTLTDGDELCFAYSMDWGVDIGSDFNNTSTKLKSVSSDTGTLSKTDDETVFELKLPEDTKKVIITPTAENKNYRFKIYKNEYTPESDNDFKRSREIPVENGDKLYIGVGHASWHTWMPDGVEETVYTVNVEIPHAEESSRPEPELSDVSQVSEISEAESSIIAADNDIAFDDMLSAVVSKVKSADHNVVGYEWENMTLARLGKMSNAEKDSYISALADYFENEKAKTATDNAKYTIVLTALGVDAGDFYGTDFVTPLLDTSLAEKQGINGIVYSLIALDTKLYEKENTSIRNKLINKILSSQLSDGGWTFFGDSYDADMTGMALQALAPYYDTDEDVKNSVNKAIDLLSGKQNSDGTYSSFGASNSDSTAQILTALTALGIDAAKDERFIKNGKSVIDGLKLFYKDGDFSHEAGGDYNKYSTAEAFYALASYSLLMNDGSRLYDMSSVKSYSLVSKEAKDSSVSESSEPSSSSTSSKVSQNNTTSSVSSASQNNTVNTADTSDIAVRYALFLSAAAAVLAALIIAQRKQNRNII